MSAHYDYWRECISEALIDAGATLTDKQIDEIAGAVEASHDNYGLAFYSPPPSDRIAAVEREWQEKLDRQGREHEAAEANAQQALRRALRVRDDTLLTVGEYGDVFTHDGRTTQIQ